jgi:hypothetical protein
MRFSFIRTGFVATATAIALTACGGHGFVPSQSAAPMTSVNAAPDTSEKCTNLDQPTWVFEGSCLYVVPLKRTGMTIKLPAYKGVTESTTLPASNVKRNIGFSIGDALGKGDIKRWKGKRFPLIGKSAGTSVLYVEAMNFQSGLTFSSTGKLIFTVTAPSLPGKTCPLSLLQTSGKWFTTPLTGKVKGTTVSFAIPVSNLKLFFPNGLPYGQSFFNVACH